jgi:hypothetical protein
LGKHHVNGAQHERFTRDQIAINSESRMTHGRMDGTNALRYRDEDHEAQTALTPKYILDPIRAMLHGKIYLDPCTTPENPCRAEEFFTPPEDGAAADWAGYGSVFVNPPYGKARERWVDKCIAEAKNNGFMPIVLLIPAHTDTACFQRAAWAAMSVCFIKSRVKFGVLRPNRRQMAASHPSALLGFNCDVTKTNLGFGWCR